MGKICEIYKGWIYIFHPYHPLVIDATDKWWVVRSTYWEYYTNLSILKMFGVWDEKNINTTMKWKYNEAKEGTGGAKEWGDL